MLQHNERNNTYAVQVKPFPCWVLFFNQKEDFDKYVANNAKKKFKLPKDADGYAVSFKDVCGFKRFVIYVDKQEHNPKKKIYNYGLVAHECIHISHMIFNYVGVETTQKNDELLTYVVQDLVNNFETYSKL